MLKYVVQSVHVDALYIQAEYFVCLNLFDLNMSFDCNMYIHPTQARGLTPREAARVQSFPDNFEFMGSYTKWYEQIGNAVPPILAKSIAEAILEVS